jgi:Transposase DDE domain
VQQPGIGFPLARVCVLLSLATGACHDLAIAPYAGKGTGETTLLRAMYDALRPGDVIVADALFDNYFLACELRERGIELVARVQAERVGTRTVEARPDGDIILWRRPNKPRGMTGEEYRRYPKELLMRQVTVDARGEENRAGVFRVVTTILDASIDGGQIGDLYERRWSGEVDIRAIKATMQMDILRCKSPEMVEKEIWMHLLAYNLIRGVMAQAAEAHQKRPRQLSFKGTLQTITAFQEAMRRAAPADREFLLQAMLRAIAQQEVGDRFGRVEPRANKRRPKAQRYLMEPRPKARKRLHKAA